MKPNIEMEYTHNDITYKLKDESLNKYYDFVIYTDGSCTKNPVVKAVVVMLFVAKELSEDIV